MGGIITIRNAKDSQEKSLVYVSREYISDLARILLDVAPTEIMVYGGEPLPEFEMEVMKSDAIGYVDMTNWSAEWFDHFLEAAGQMRSQDFIGREDAHLPYAILIDACLIALMQLDPRSGITHFPTRTIRVNDDWIWNTPQWLFEMTLSVWASAIKPFVPPLAEQWFTLGTTVGEETVDLEQIQRDLPTETFTKALRSVQYYMAHICVKVCHNMAFVLRDPRFYAEAPLPLLRLYSMLDLVVPRERPETDL